MIIVRSEPEVRAIRAAGRIVAFALGRVSSIVSPGVKTEELDRLADQAIRSMGGYPAFKGYKGYPASICVSVNECVVHGIPSKRRLKEGDIVSVDIGVRYQDYFADAAATYGVGKVSDEAGRLMRVTEESLYSGLSQARAGNRLSDISWSVQSHVEAHGFSVVRDFVGHGIGTELHEDPEIPNYGKPSRGPRLEEGMILAVEPMVNAGAYDVEIGKDGWAVTTSDGSMSAHFEHTIVVRSCGPEILTRADD